MHGRQRPKCKEQMLTLHKECTFPYELSRKIYFSRLLHPQRFHWVNLRDANKASSCNPHASGTFSSYKLDMVQALHMHSTGHAIHMHSTRHAIHMHKATCKRYANAPVLRRHACELSSILSAHACLQTAMRTCTRSDEARHVAKPLTSTRDEVV